MDHEHTPLTLSGSPRAHAYTHTCATSGMHHSSTCDHSTCDLYMHVSSATSATYMCMAHTHQSQLYTNTPICTCLHPDHATTNTPHTTYTHHRLSCCRPVSIPSAGASAAAPSAPSSLLLHSVTHSRHTHTQTRQYTTSSTHFHHQAAIPARQHWLHCQHTCSSTISSFHLLSSLHQCLCNTATRAL